MFYRVFAEIQYDENSQKRRHIVDKSVHSFIYTDIKPTKITKNTIINI